MEILDYRLQVLEQEYEKMKEVLFVCMNERKEIISEIMQLFQMKISETKHLFCLYQVIYHSAS
ncbi:Gap junction alpha-9 protein [Bienertia sinuspersici]